MRNGEKMKTRAIKVSNKKQPPIIPEQKWRTLVCIIKF
jgi:hypothetical protein